MAVQIERLNADNFIDVVQSTLYAIVRVGRRPPMGFHKGVAEFFDATYPRLFSFGTLNARSIRDPEWWGHNFQSSLGPLRNAGSDGYFLFQAGSVIAHHAGVVSHARVSYADASDDGQARERIRAAAFNSRQRVSPADLDACVKVVAFLDEHVQRKQRDAGFGQDSYTSQGSSPHGGSAHNAGSFRRPSMPVPGEDDPYDLLGVTPDVDLETLKAAFKEQMKLNHPDKVSHMSKAIQDFASAQVKAIKSAFDVVKGNHQ